MKTADDRWHCSASPNQRHHLVEQVPRSPIFACRYCNVTLTLATASHEFTPKEAQTNLFAPDGASFNGPLVRRYGRSMADTITSG